MSVKARSPRVAAERLAPSQVLAYGETIRALLRAEPTLTVPELVHRTGAPPRLATIVRRKWRFETSSRSTP